MQYTAILSNAKTVLSNVESLERTKNKKDETVEAGVEKYCSYNFHRLHRTAENTYAQCAEKTLNKIIKYINKTNTG